MLKKRNGYFSSKSKWKVKSNNAVKKRNFHTAPKPPGQIPAAREQDQSPPRRQKRNKRRPIAIDQIKRSCNTAQRNEQSPKDMEITPEANSIPQRQKDGHRENSFRRSKRLRYSDRHNNGQSAICLPYCKWIKASSKGKDRFPESQT